MKLLKEIMDMDYSRRDAENDAGMDRQENAFINVVDEMYFHVDDLIADLPMPLNVAKKMLDALAKKFRVRDPGDLYIARELWDPEKAESLAENYKFKSLFRAIASVVETKEDIMNGDYVQDRLRDQAERDEERSDPYGSRGLRKSDFY